MHYPKISIVTPSYNQGAFIEETIDSLLSQNYPALEYIIIDGGSTDNTIEMIKKYEKSISYWESKPDNGQSHAINKGLNKCTGDIFNWLNSDDYLEKKSLFTIAEHFQNSGINLVGGKSKKFSSNTFEKVVPETFYHQTIEEKIVSPLYMQPSTFIRMDCIKQMGFLNEDLHYSMDYEWILRYLLLFGKENIIETDTILSYARLHSNSKTNMDIPKFRMETLYIYFQLAQLMNLSPESINGCRYRGLSPDLNISLNLKLEIDLNKEELIQNIKKIVEPYNKDVSFLYRETAAYYNYFGQKKEALKACTSAVIANPTVFLNYKFFIKELFNLA